MRQALKPEEGTGAVSHNYVVISSSMGTDTVFYLEVGECDDDVGDVFWVADAEGGVFGFVGWCVGGEAIVEGGEAGDVLKCR
jgi:uncharacterized protein with LGFP repeats